MSENAERSDRELLQAFVAHQDRGALEALVTRHSSLVLRTCRRVLRAGHHVEDAFQTTFLILVTRPPSPRKTSSIAGWLYRVAWRTSMRIATATYQEADFDIDEMVSSLPGPFIEIQRRELMRVLDEELNDLPQRYRDVIVLCHLEGRSRVQAAAELGCTEASVKASLARGRTLLRMRLLRRRVFPAMAIAAVASSLDDCAEASPLVSSTIDLCVQGHSEVLAPSDIQSVLKSGIRPMNFSSAVKVAVSTVSASLLLAFMVSDGASVGASDAQPQSALQPQISTVVIEGDDEFDVIHSSTRTITASNSNPAMDHPTIVYKLATAAALRTKAKAKMIEAEAMATDRAERSEMLDASRRLWALGESAELAARANLLESEGQQSRSNDAAGGELDRKQKRHVSETMIYGPPGQRPLRVGDTVMIEQKIEGHLTKRQFTIDRDGVITLDEETQLKAAGLKLDELGRLIHNSSRKGRK